MNCRENAENFQRVRFLFFEGGRAIKKQALQGLEEAA
jgi:hypothetical protein